MNQGTLKYVQFSDKYKHDYLYKRERFERAKLLLQASPSDPRIKELYDDAHFYCDESEEIDPSTWEVQYSTVQYSTDSAKYFTYPVATLRRRCELTGSVFQLACKT